MGEYGQPHYGMGYAAGGWGSPASGYYPPAGERTPMPAAGHMPGSAMYPPGAGQMPAGHMPYPPASFPQPAAAPAGTPFWTAASPVAAASEGWPSAGFAGVGAGGAGGGGGGGGGGGAAGSWQRVPGGMGGSTPGTVGRATPTGRLWADPVGGLTGGPRHGSSAFGDGGAPPGSAATLGHGETTPQSGGRGGSLSSAGRSPMDAFDDGAMDLGSGRFEPPERSLEEEEEAGAGAEEPSPSIFGSGGGERGRAPTPPSAGRYKASPSPGGSASRLGRAPRGDAGAGTGAWVKIWGFERSLRGAVVRELQRVGDVADWVDGEGNWTFVRFGDPAGAQRAIARSGSALLAGVIVGISAATPEELHKVRPDSLPPSSSERARTMPDGLASFTPSPWTRRVHFAPGDATTPDRGAAPPSTGRPDTASTFSHIERLRRPAVPRPAGGLWAQIQEYILGI